MKEIKQHTDTVHTTTVNPILHKTIPNSPMRLPPGNCTMNKLIRDISIPRTEESASNTRMFIELTKTLCLLMEPSTSSHKKRVLRRKSI